MRRFLILKTNMKENNQSIGIFDSGLGGLTVLKEMKKILPKESFIYFGDIAHLPYGNKSKESIFEYSNIISQYLYSQKIKSLIVACNTASAIAYAKIYKQIPVPVFNVIDASVEQAVKKTQTECIGIIGTDVTVNSNAYQIKIHQINSNINIIAKPCPLFVPLVEENLLNHKITYDIAEYYLEEIIKSNADTLILGCTHYPLLYHAIKKTIGDKIHIINSSLLTAQKIKQVLFNQGLLKTKEKKVEDKFYVSDKPKQFNKLAKIFLNKPSLKVEKIIL